MRLYLVRHGEALNNVRKHYAEDESASTLTERGKKQAAAVAKRFKDVPIDVIACSKYERAVKTAGEILKKQAKCKIVYTPLLNEWRVPTEFKGKSVDDPSVMKVWEKMGKHRLDRKWHYSDEENHLEFMDRGSKCIDFLEGLSKENVLVVSHGLMIRNICSLLLVQRNRHYGEWVGEYGEEPYLKLIVHLFGSLPTANTGITVVERETDGPWRLRTFNDFSHL